MNLRYSNCKINNQIIDNILKSNITSYQIDILLWLARRQNNFGKISEVKYYDVCNDIGMSNQEYYDAIYGLVNLGFIRIIERSYKYGWDIEILDNANFNETHDKQRYLNINRAVLYSKKFRSLKANEKKLVLKVALEKLNNKDFFLKLSTLSKWIGIDNKQLIKSYISKLKSLFEITFSKHTGIFILKSKIDMRFDPTSEFTHLFRYKIKTICRRMKLFIYNEDIFDEVITIFYQYRKSIHISILYSIMISSLEQMKSLEPAHINWSVQRYINEGII